jgi:hypothetical protein
MCSIVAFASMIGMRALAFGGDRVDTAESAIWHVRGSIRKRSANLQNHASVNAGTAMRLRHRRRCNVTIMLTRLSQIASQRRNRNRPSDRGHILRVLPDG